MIVNFLLRFKMKFLWHNSFCPLSINSVIFHIERNKGSHIKNIKQLFPWGINLKMSFILTKQLFLCSVYFSSHQIYNEVILFIILYWVIILSLLFKIIHIFSYSAFCTFEYVCIQIKFVTLLMPSITLLKLSEFTSK